MRLLCFTLIQTWCYYSKQNGEKEKRERGVFYMYEYMCVCVAFDSQLKEHNTNPFIHIFWVPIANHNYIFFKTSILLYILNVPHW